MLTDGICYDLFREVAISTIPTMRAASAGTIVIVRSPQVNTYALFPNMNTTAAAKQQTIPTTNLTLDI